MDWTLAEPDVLRDAWRELDAEAGGPIEAYEWTASWIAASGSAGDVEIATVTMDGRLAAVAPLAVRRRRGVRRRMLLGVDTHGEPMDLLARDGAALDALAHRLAHERLPIEFGRLPADTPSLAALRRAFRGGWIVRTQPRAPFPRIRLDDSWREPETHLSARRRSDLRRARRRAERLGPVTSEVRRPEPGELDALLDEAFATEARSWKGAAGTAILADPHQAQFIRRYARAACLRGSLRLAFLRIGGRAAAMQIGVVAGGSLWLLKIGYDAEYAPCSPGILLMRDAIASAAAAGLRSFEFLGRNEPWIGMWTRDERHTTAVRAYPVNGLGLAALAADTAARVPAYVRRHRPGERQARRLAGKMLTPALRRAPRRYVAGETLDAAREVAGGLVAQGRSVTLGFWDGPADTPREVADRYLAALDALPASDVDAYVSVKLPALGFSADLLAEVVARAERAGRRVHLDALAPESVMRTRTTVEEVRRSHPRAAMGTTLPARWARSPEDAGWACAHGLHVRVVKGQWPDYADPGRDPRAGFLAVIDALAGRAAHVAVATHDADLAAEALVRLRAVGTPCCLELLYGLPMTRPLRVAARLDADVRVYVPYGAAYMPYALSQLRTHPRVAVWLARDVLATALPGRRA